MADPKGPYDSDESQAGPTIHVPASGRVEDAPKPNSAEPYNESVRLTGIERVNEELESGGSLPDQHIKDGVQNPYISEDTKRGAERTDNAATTPQTYAQELGHDRNEQSHEHQTRDPYDRNAVAPAMERPADDERDIDDEQDAEDDDTLDDDATPSEPIV